MEMVKIRKGFKGHADILYTLLLERTHGISHRQMPSYEDHVKFIDNNPYRAWYLVKSGNRYIGHVYLLEQDNTMGLVFNAPKFVDVQFAVDFLKENYKPMPAIKSVRSPYFVVNIAPTNKDMADIIEKLNGELVQVTYVLK